MRLPVVWQYLSFAGRLSRRRFNHAVLCLLVLLSGWLFAPAPVTAAAGVWPALALLVILACLTVLRLHDTGLRGLWLLTLAVPLAGPLWLVWRLCLRRGMTGENRFGPQPDAPSPDYLEVS